MKRVGFLGAFSIDNAGDALVGYAGRQALRALVPDAEQVVFAPAFPQPFWGHAFTRDRGIDAEIVPVPVDTDMVWARGLDALVIGGGGIINLDPAFRPFLLGGPERRDGLPPAAWNAVCSQNQPWYAGAHRETYEAVRRCCETLRYVSVRNRTTLTFVRRCGYEGEIHLVPDPALLLSLPPEVDPAVDRLLEELGVDASGLVIGVSIGPSVEDAGTAEFYRDVFAALRRVTSDVGARIVLFPFSHMQGEERLQDAIAAQLSGAVVVRRRLLPLELWRLIGRMGFYIGCRYHAMLAAFAQNVPFIVLDEYLSDQMASSKTREFVADLGLEPHYLCPYLPARPSWKIEEGVRARAAVSFADRLEGLRGRLRAHHASMVRALGLA